MENKHVQDGTKDVKRELGRIERSKAFLLEIFVFIFVIFATIAIVLAVHKHNESKDKTSTQEQQSTQTTVEEEQQTEPQNLITEIDESKIIEKDYTQTELEQLAVEYYAAKNGYRPSNVESEIDAEGLLRISLSDDVDTGLYEWYTVDIKNAVGKDAIGNKINLNDK